MKNVIALGLVACAALFNVQPAEANVVNDVEMWRLTCSDHNPAMWDWLDSAQGKKLYSAKYGTKAWDNQQAARKEYTSKCAEYMPKFMKENPEAPAYEGMEAFHQSYVKEFEAKLKAIK